MSRRSSSAIDPNAEIRERPSERGASLAALLAGLTVMLIGLGAAAPTWHYLVQNDREQELMFRGLEIVRALRLYQRYMGQSLPPNIDPLVKAKYLRRAYSDPMFPPDGKWEIIRQGIPAEGCPQTPDGAPQVGAPPGHPQQQPQHPQQPQPNQNQNQSGGPRMESGGDPIGPVSGMIGVRSRSRAQSLRIMMGKNHYHEWCFTIHTIPPTVYSIKQLTGLQQGQTAPPFEKIPGRDWSRPPLWNPPVGGGGGSDLPTEESFE
jgi:hypothetical protein